MQINWDSFVSKSFVAHKLKHYLIETLLRSSGTPINTGMCYTCMYTSRLYTCTYPPQVLECDLPSAISIVTVIDGWSRSCTCMYAKVLWIICLTSKVSLWIFSSLTAFLSMSTWLLSCAGWRGTETGRRKNGCTGEVHWGIRSIVGTLTSLQTVCIAYTFNVPSSWHQYNACTVLDRYKQMRITPTRYWRSMMGTL